MILLPVVTRELNVAARQKSTHRIRMLGATVGIVAMTWLLVVSAAGMVSGQQGQDLFRGISLVVFLFCLAAGPILTSDAISSEKREGTLGLLFLTDLRGIDIIWGKLVAASIAAVFAVLALIPVLAMALLLGGVTLMDLARASLVWFATLFASVSLGILVSTVSRDDRKAVAAAVVLSIALGYGAYAPASLVESMELKTFADSLKIFSAGFAQATANDWLVGSRAWLDFSASITFLFLVGASSQALAAKWVPAQGGERPKSHRRTLVEAMVHQWAYGDPIQRAIRRGRLLDKNPFLWLNSRHQRKTQYMWGFLASMLVIWLWLARTIPYLATDWYFNVFTFLALHGLIKVWWLSEVAERFVEDRRNGAVELVFTTSVSPIEFAQGQSLALRHTFGGPILGMLGLEIVWLLHFCANISEVGKPTAILLLVIGWAVLGVDLWALKWLGLWNALIRSSAQRATAAAFNAIALVPWAAILSITTSASVLATRFLSFYMTAESWRHFHLQVYGTVALVFALLFGFRARRRFLVAFRRVASEGYSAQAAEAVLDQVPLQKTTEPTSTLDEKPAARRSWIRRHPIPSIACGMLLLVLLSIGSARLYWRFQLNSRIAAIKTSGQPVSIADYNTALEAPSKGVLERELETTMALIRVRELDNAGWMARLEQRDPKMIQALPALIATNQRAFNVLDKAHQLPTQFSRAERNNLLMGGRPVSDLCQRLATLGFARGLVQLENQNSTGAVETAIQLLRLSLYARTRSELGGFHGYHRCATIAINLLEKVSAQAPIAASQRQTIDGLLENIESTHALRQRLLLIQAAAVDLHDLDSNWSALSRFTGPSIASTVRGLASTTGFTDRKLSESLDIMKPILDASQVDDPTLVRQAQSLAAAPTFGDMTLMPIGSFLVAGMPNLVQSDRTLAARARATRLALVAEAFAEQRQRWPSALPELVRATRSTNSWINPITGQPLELWPLDDKKGIWIRVEGTGKPFLHKSAPSRIAADHQGFLIERQISP